MNHRDTENTEREKRRGSFSLFLRVFSVFSVSCMFVFRSPFPRGEGGRGVRANSVFAVLPGFRPTALNRINPYVS